MFSLPQNLVKTLELVHVKKFRFPFLVESYEKVMPTCISWCSNRLKNGPYPNCQLRLICFIRANVVKIIKKQSNPTHSIQYKAIIEIFSLARNILVVDGHFSVFPSIRINLGSFFRMEHRAHQNPHCRFSFFSKKNRYQSLKSTKEATWSSACVMTKESCRSSSIMCRSRKAYKLFFF